MIRQVPPLDILGLGCYGRKKALKMEVVFIQVGSTNWADTMAIEISIHMEWNKRSQFLLSLIVRWNQESGYTPYCIGRERPMHLFPSLFND